MRITCVLAWPVADFGVARRLSSRSESMTAETGTYRWMAPEVIRHTRYDHRVDVYSFGIVAWEMLSGQLPYGELSPIQAAAAVVVENLRPPLGEGALPRGMPAALTSLVRRCWDVDPTARPEFRDVAVAVGALREAEAARVAAGGAEHDDEGDAAGAGGAPLLHAHASPPASALPPLALPPPRPPSSDGGASGTPSSIPSNPIDVPVGGGMAMSLSDLSADDDRDLPSYGALTAAAPAGALGGKGSRRRSRGLLDMMGCCTQPGMGKSL
jgi:serine/threonine protein kinase